MISKSLSRYIGRAVRVNNTSLSIHDLCYFLMNQFFVISCARDFLDGLTSTSECDGYGNYKSLQVDLYENIL